MNQPIIPAGMDLAALQINAQQVNSFIAGIVEAINVYKLQPDVAFFACAYMAGVVSHGSQHSTEEIVNLARSVIDKARSDEARKAADRALKQAGIIRP